MIKIPIFFFLLRLFVSKSMMLGKKGKAPLSRPFFRPCHGEGCMVKNREKG
jgi:hypothetical protein